MISNPEQIFVIIREDLRRIFIWNGPKSATRDKFVSSRTVIALQDELRSECGLRPCKVISVDMGDEPLEFLSAFNIPNMGNALRKVRGMMGEIRSLSLKRKFLPNIFSGDLLENSKTDELPTFKSFVIRYFESCGIAVRVLETTINFYEDIINPKIF